MTAAADLFLDPDEATVADAKTITWLASKGIPVKALAEPWAVHVGKVLFVDQHLYVPNRLGNSCLIMAVIDDGIIDLAAWDPRSGRIGARLGQGGCLGQGQIGRDGFGTHGPALPVWRTPIGWLAAERRGVVIVDPPIAAHQLAGITIEAEDQHHVDDLRRLLVVPPPTIFANAAREAA